MGEQVEQYGKWENGVNVTWIDKEKAIQDNPDIYQAIFDFKLKDLGELEKQVEGLETIEIKQEDDVFNS